MSDKYYIDASSFLEVTSELADFIMQEKLGNEYEKFIYEDESQVINYTKSGQEMFDDYVGDVERYLGSVSIVHEDLKENKEENV